MLQLKLKVGDFAPDFDAYDQDGKFFRLSNQRTKKIILFFYPNDDSETCTKEACNFRDHYLKLKKGGYDVIGISHAPPISKKKFAVKYNLQYKLLADIDLKICNAFGVYGEKLFMGKKIQTIHRITFIINTENRIEKIISQVKSAIASEQIFES